MEIGFRWLLSFLRSFRFTLHLNCLAVRARPPYKIVVLLVQDPTASFWFATSLQERGFYTMKGRKKGEVETNCRLPLVKQTSSRRCEMMRLGEIYWFSTLLLFLLPPFVVSFWPTTMKEFVLNAKQQQPNGAGRSLIIFMLFYIQNYMCRGFPSACFLQDLVCVFVVLLICRLTFFPVCLPWSLLKVRHFFFLELLAEICFALLLLLLLSN